MPKKSIRSSDMPEKLITVTAYGLTDDEKEELEQRNRATIRALNHRSEGKIKYQVVFS